ncbi:MAG: glycosyltransferase family 1 protein [Candidatus Aureabacteria bacterium]|nr:glycosyltransferase family 1 protein [Candidatus Auribacterota bacterium]
MRIGIDIQTTIGAPTGVGRYTTQLVLSLAGLGGDEEYRLFFFDFLRRGCRVRPGNPRFTIRPVRVIPGRIYELLSARTGWPPIELFSGRCDIFHFPNFIIPPLGSGRAEVTVCDCSFARFPHYAEGRNLRRLERSFKGTLDRADAVIAISEFSKRELMEIYGVSAERIFVTHLGVDMPPPSPRGSEAARPYFLFVGTVEPRKNLGGLLDAWRIARGRATSWRHSLVIAGGRGGGCPSVLEQARLKGVERDVIVRDYVSDGELAALYRGAEALVFPSFYEGFGLPPLEAMASGTPVIASRIPAVVEVVGDMALLCDPHNPEEIAEAMHRVIGDEALRKKLIAGGIGRAKAFTWQKTAEKTLALYRDLLV